jgi:hypothetical protein
MRFMFTWPATACTQSTTAAAGAAADMLLGVVLFRHQVQVQEAGVAAGAALQGQAATGALNTTPGGRIHQAHRVLPAAAAQLLLGAAAMVCIGKGGGGSPWCCCCRP